MAQNTQLRKAPETGANLVVNNAFIDGLSEQLRIKQEYGLSFPADYNPTNALMGAYLVLKETVDRNKKPVLESCSQASIANCLMTMVTSGLSMQKKQCYPVAYGGKLQCMVSYFGHMTMARRFGAKSINAECIYDGDTFRYHIENGVKIIDEHTQDFMNVNMDKIIGAYCVIGLSDGSTYTEIMNINQIKTAWKKGFGYSEGKGVHAEFTDMMAKKTVTSRACKRIVQQYGDEFVSDIMDATESYDKAENVTADVKHDIEVNANTVDIMDAIVPEAVEEPVAAESTAEVIPEFMSAE